MYNKDKYKEILDYVKEDLDLVNCEIKSLLFEYNTRLKEDISEFLFAKSKRLRPLVFFLIKNALCGNFCGEPSAHGKNLHSPNARTDIIKLAAALELLHSATLIHDDIIDEASMRRLLPAMNVKYGSKIAVISGDYLLSLCLRELSELNSPEIFKYFSENTLNICKGEIDQFFNKNKIVTIEEYIEKSKNKTSSLFVAGVKSLLHIINRIEPVSDTVQKALLEYVLNFSLAFQIYDDIENFESNFENGASEKSSSDIENGIYTLPYLYISQQKNYYGMIDLKNDLSKEIYNEALNFSKKYLNNILNEALKNLDTIKNEYKTDQLQKLVETFKI